MPERKLFLLSAGDLFNVFSLPGQEVISGKPVKKIRKTVKIVKKRFIIFALLHKME